MEGKTWQNIGKAAWRISWPPLLASWRSCSQALLLFQKSQADRIFFRYFHFSFLTFSKRKYNWHLHCSSCMHKSGVVWQFLVLFVKPELCSKNVFKNNNKNVPQKSERNGVWKSATFIWRRGEQLLVKSQSSFQLSLLLKLLLQMFAT